MGENDHTIVVVVRVIDERFEKRRGSVLKWRFLWRGTRFVFVVRRVEICFFHGVHFLDALISSVAVDFGMVGGRVAVVTEERCIHFYIVPLHLIVAENQGLKSVNISDLLQTFSIVLYNVEDKRFEVFSFDELKQFQTCRV